MSKKQARDGITKSTIDMQGVTLEAQNIGGGGGGGGVTPAQVNALIVAKTGDTANLTTNAKELTGAVNEVKADAVSLTQNQNIAGNKIFTQPVQVGQPTNDGHATPRSYVDRAIIRDYPNLQNLPTINNQAFTGDWTMDRMGVTTAIDAKVGVLSTLPTTAKGTVVAAITELHNNDGQNVKITGNQNIDGDKTFSGTILSSGKIQGAVSGTNFIIAPNVNQAKTLSLHDNAVGANCYFNLDLKNIARVINMPLPTADDQGASKGYVDTSIRTTVGDKNALVTTDKTTLVHAINEIANKANNAVNGMNYVGIITNTNAEITANKGLLDAFVQLKEQRPAQKGDLVFTSDNYSWIYGDGQWETKTDPIATTQTAGVIKLGSSKGDITTDATGKASVLGWADVGDITTLTTTNKSNLVSAVNEVASKTYNELTNKPSVNGIILEGNKNFDDLGITPFVEGITGQLNDLQTTNKGNLVQSVNEVQGNTLKKTGTAVQETTSPIKFIGNNSGLTLQSQTDNAFIAMNYKNSDNSTIFSMGRLTPSAWNRFVFLADQAGFYYQFDSPLYFNNTVRFTRDTQVVNRRYIDQTVGSVGALGTPDKTNVVNAINSILSTFGTVGGQTRVASSFVRPQDDSGLGNGWTSVNTSTTIAAGTVFTHVFLCCQSNVAAGSINGEIIFVDADTRLILSKITLNAQAVEASTLFDNRRVIIATLPNGNPHPDKKLWIGFRFTGGVAVQMRQYTVDTAGYLGQMPNTNLGTAIPASASDRAVEFAVGTITQSQFLTKIVKTEGSQTISGDKTFTGVVKSQGIGGQYVLQGNAALYLEWLDNNNTRRFVVGCPSVNTPNLFTFLAGNQSGEFRFDNKVSLQTGVQITDNQQLTTKLYVDNKVANPFSRRGDMTLDDLLSLVESLQQKIEVLEEKLGGGK